MSPRGDSGAKKTREHKTGRVRALPPLGRLSCPQVWSVGFQALSSSIPEPMN